MNVLKLSPQVPSAINWMPTAVALKTELRGRQAPSIQLPKGAMPAAGWPLVLVVSTGFGHQLLAAQAILAWQLKRWGCAVATLASTPNRSELAGLTDGLRSAVGHAATVDPGRFGIAQLRDDGVALHAFNGSQAANAFMEIDAASGAEELAMWMTENLW